jgi:hypothetical protein
MLEAGSREDIMVVSPTGSGPGPGGVLSASPWHGEKNPVMMLHGSTSLDDADERGSIVSMESDGSTNGPFFWYRVFSKFSPGPRNCESHTHRKRGEERETMWVFVFNLSGGLS